MTFIYREVLKYETRIMALNREVMRLNDIIGKDMPCLISELESARAMIAKLKAEHACCATERRGSRPEGGRR